MRKYNLDGSSLDILEENIRKMKELFPEVFTEEKIDFEKLQQVLGEYIEDEAERYDFTWNGKKDALRISQTPTTGTLRPDKENSKNWEETENIYIEGDNLEVLKLLQKSYHSKIKMIYIDIILQRLIQFNYPKNVVPRGVQSQKGVCSGRSRGNSAIFKTYNAT